MSILLGLLAVVVILSLVHWGRTRRQAGYSRGYLDALQQVKRVNDRAEEERDAGKPWRVLS